MQSVIRIGWVMQDITVEAFIWEDRDGGNLEHCARHGVTPVVAAAVLGESPRFFLNDPGKTGTHMMIGPDDNGRFWTVVILPGAEPGQWKPITGWPSTTTEIGRYNGEA